MWTLSELHDPARVLQRCADLSAGALGGLARGAAILVEAGASTEERVHAFLVPGRLEILGKHCDYAGGRSLVAAVESGFVVLARPRGDARIRILDAGRRRRDEFAFDPDLGEGEEEWMRWPRGVARRLARNLPADGEAAPHGVDIALSSDLPPGAGLASSSAFVVAIYQALVRASGLDTDPRYLAALDSSEAVAAYLEAIESDRAFGPFEGGAQGSTLGALEDHTAILNSRAGELRQYRYGPVLHERSLPVPAGWTFAVASSGVHPGAGGRRGIERLRRMASAATQAWRRVAGLDAPHLAAILERDPWSKDLDRWRRVLKQAAPVDGFDAPTLLRRVEHFLLESEDLVPSAGDALARGDRDSFCRLVDRSQELGAQLLGNQVRETLSLARAARDLGAAASSSFGKGFGGSVWALVQTETAADFLAAWRGRYAAEFPDRREDAAFFVSGAGAGAGEI